MTTSASQTSARTHAGLAKPGVLLLAALPVFVGYLLVAATTLATKVEQSSAELAPNELDAMAGSWVLLSALWTAAVILAAAGLVSFGRILDQAGRIGAMVRPVAVLSVGLILAWFAVQLVQLRTDTPRIGDSALYTVGVALSLFSFWAAIIATIGACVALRRARIATIAATVVATLMVLYFAFDLLTYLPAFFGSVDLKEAVGLPPFLMSVIWAILGTAVLRRGVPFRE